MPETYLCPTCDHQVIVGKSCKVCAKNDLARTRKRKKKKPPVAKKKPWEQDEIYDGLDLPDDDFDYDSFVEKEFGTSTRPPHKQIGIAWYWWVIAILLVSVWLYFYVL